VEEFLLWTIVMSILREQVTFEADRYPVRLTLLFSASRNLGPCLTVSIGEVPITVLQYFNTCANVMRAVDDY